MSSEGNSQDLSVCSKVSAKHMSRIIDKLLMNQTRESTAKNYLMILRRFNKFLLTLDIMPKFWEDRMTLFMGYLIEKGAQSATIKSYVSGIKKMLLGDGYPWEDKKILLTSLTKACRIVNDHVSTRLPIHCSLLECILFEIQRNFAKNNQIYLEKLYKAIFILGYYGLMRVSELVLSKHVLKAANVHSATNKDKLLLVLYSSKKHDEGALPQ